MKKLIIIFFIMGLNIHAQDWGYAAAQDSILNKINKSVNTLYVGSVSPYLYRTISSAIMNASAGQIIEITNGDYTENLTVNKGLTFIGTGTVTINGKVTVTDTVLIKNITVSNNAASTDTVINLQSGYLNIENVKVRGIINIASGKLNHSRGVQFGGVLINGSAVYNANGLDSMSQKSGYASAIKLRNSANAEIHCYYSDIGLEANNVSTANFSCKKFRSSVVTHDSASVIVSNTYSEYLSYFVTAGGTIKLFNVTSLFSFPDTTTGKHNLEMSSGYPNNRMEIYNSYFEFTGFQGSTFTSGGSPVEALQGTFIASNSTFINNNGGKAPVGYSTVIKLSNRTKAYITGCKIQYKQDLYSGEDGTGINFGKNDSYDMDIKIVNNVIETDSNGAFSFGLGESSLSGTSLIFPHNNILTASDRCLISNNTWINKGNNERFVISSTNITNWDSLYAVLSNWNYQTITKTTNIQSFGEKNVLSGDVYVSSKETNLWGGGDYARSAMKRRLILDSTYYFSGNISNDSTLLISGAVITGSGNEIMFPRKGGGGVSLYAEGRIYPETSSNVNSRLGTSTARYYYASIDNVSYRYRTTTAASGPFSNNDKGLFVDAAGGNKTVTINPAIGSGFEFVLKKIDSSANTVTLDPDGSATIDGAATYVLTTQHQYVEFVSDGTNFYKIGGN